MALLKLNYKLKTILLMSAYLVSHSPKLYAEDGFDSFSFGGLTENERFFTRDYQEQQRIAEFQQTVSEKLYQAEELEAEAKREENGFVGESSSIQPRRATWYKSMAYGTLYHSNIFKDRIDAIDDFIYIYAPMIGIKLGRPGTSRAYLDTNYRFSYADYVENQKLTQFGQKWSTNMGYNFGRLALKLSNTLLPNSTFDTGERTDLTSAGSKHVVAYSNGASMNANYKLTEKVTVSSRYGHSVFYFPVASNTANPNAPGNSYQTHSLSPSISYKLTPRTSLTSSYFFSTTDYFQGGDKASKNHSLSLGISHDFTAKTFLDLKAGYTIIDYNQPSFPVLEGESFGLSVSHQLAPKLRVLLAASRGTNENFDQSNAVDAAAGTSSSMSDIYTTQLSWTLNPTMSVSAQGSASFQEKEGLYTYPDPDNPTLSFTRANETDVYKYLIAYQWKPKVPISFYFAYEFSNNNGSFKNLENDYQRVLGSARWVF